MRSMRPRHVSWLVLLGLGLLGTVGVHGTLRAQGGAIPPSAICRTPGEDIDHDLRANIGGNVYYVGEGAGRVICGMVEQAPFDSVGPNGLVDTDDDLYVYYDDENGTPTTANAHTLWCDVFTFGAEAEQTAWFAEPRLYGSASATGSTTPPSTAFASSGVLFFSNIRRESQMTTVTVTCNIPDHTGWNRASEITSFLYDVD